MNVCDAGMGLLGCCPQNTHAKVKETNARHLQEKASLQVGRGGDHMTSITGTLSLGEAMRPCHAVGNPSMASILRLLKRGDQLIW